MTNEATLFGKFTLTLDGVTYDSFRTSKVQALLAYLLIERPAPVRRYVVGELLWPGMPRRSVLTNVRQTVYLVRKLLKTVSESPLISAGGTLQLNPELVIATDIGAFDRLVDSTIRHEHTDLSLCTDCQRKLKQAVALYRGDLLADLFLDDSVDFERWAEQRRVAYRQRYFDALTNLTQGHLRSGRYVEAEAAARSQLKRDNLREIAYRQLMRALAGSGQREAALSIFERCREHLLIELGMEPTRRTINLAEQIVSGDLEMSPAPTPSVRGYELLEAVGDGAFGVVHRAYQPLIEREVAIKIIKPQHANRPDFIRRFEVEAQTIARLEHAHIVPLYDYWREPDGAFLVMRYMRGGNLEQVLEAGGPWSLDRTVPLVDQLSDALSAAHREGIVHRDLKPSNILLDEEGNAYLSDFGIAYRTAAPTMAIGAPPIMSSSPAHSSPEQLRGEPLSARSDIYSLGLLIFELLTGRKPFSDRSLGQVVHKQLAAELPDLALFRPDLPESVGQVLRKATEKQPNLRYENVRELALGLRQALGRGNGFGVLPIQPTPAVEGSPYKGLHAYQEADAALFFGRDDLIAQLVERLTQSRFLAVVGPSGSGKSSVVKAGLLPRVRRGAVDGSDRWFITEMTPGPHPLEELEAALLRVAVEPPASLLEPLERDRRGLTRVLKRILPAGDDGGAGELLLVVDQFEELFMLVDDAERRGRFLDNLLTALADDRSQLHVVVTLRADFFDRPLQVPGLAELFQRHNIVVTPLSGKELERAIVQPALLAGQRFEEGLVAQIMRDAGDEPGMLPLLQVALSELYEQRQGGRLTGTAYRSLGSLNGVLGRRAESVYQQLSPAGRLFARQMFLRLVTLGEGTEDMRRRVSQSELAQLQIDPEGAENGSPQRLNPQQQSILEAYGRARLLSFDHDPVSRTPTVEVAHEALLRAWPRLRDWLAESRDDLRLQRRLAQVAAEWESEPDDSYLLRGGRLDRYSDWAHDAPLTLTTSERAFLDASFRARDQRRAEAEQRRRQELAMARQLTEEQGQRLAVQRRSARRLGRLAVGLALAMTIAFGAAWQALVRGQEAQSNFRQSETVRLALQAQNALEREADAELAVLLAVRSLQLGYTAAADAALQAALAQGLPLQTFRGHTDTIDDAVFSSDGRRIVTISKDGTARLWDVQTGEELRRFEGHNGPANFVALSPDDRRLLTSGGDGTVRMWDVESGRQLFQFDGELGLSGDVEFSPNGTLFAHGATQQIDIRSTRTGLLVKRIAIPFQNSYNAQFSPDGLRMAVSGLEGDPGIWDLRTGRRLQTFSGHQGWVAWIDFSSDGRYVFTTGVDRTVRVWDAATGVELRRLQGHTAPLYGADFGIDWQTLVSSGHDGTVRVWDVPSGRQLRRIHAHSDVAYARFSPDQRLILTVGGDALGRLWSATADTQPLRRVSHADDYFPDQTLQQLSADRRKLLIGRTSGLAQIVDVETGQVDRELRIGSEQINALALSQDGRWLASGDQAGEVRLIDTQSGRASWSLGGQSAAVYAVQFSPDGQTVLTAAADGSLRLLDRQSGRLQQQWVAHDEAVVSVDFAAGRIVSGGADGLVLLWDSATGERLGTFEGHGGPVHAVALAVDGRAILSGSADQTARLWDVESGGELLQLTEHGESVLHVAFSSDELTLLTGSADRTARLWDRQTGSQLHQFGGHLSSLMDATFSTDGSRVFTADSQALYEWPATLEATIAWACARLTRDLSDEERALYDIADREATCPQQTLTADGAQPRWTPIAAPPNSAPRLLRLRSAEPAIVADGFPLQQIYVPAGSDTVTRLLTIEDRHLELPVFSAAEPITELLGTGPVPMGEPLGITLGAYVAAGGQGSYTLKGRRAELDLRMHSLIPGGVYTLWCLELHPTTFEIFAELPCGTPDGSQSAFIADANGDAHINLELDAFPLSTAERMYEVAVAYHSDGQTYGSSPGEFGRNVHTVLFYDFLPP